MRLLQYVSLCMCVLVTRLAGVPWSPQSWWRHRH